MSDLISREAAIEAVGDVHPLDYNGQAILYRIKALPTIDPVKKGKWIKHDGSLWNMANCSECGEMCVLGDTAKFCPFCGATMVGVITKKRGRR